MADRLVWLSVRQRETQMAKLMGSHLERLLVQHLVILLDLHWVSELGLQLEKPPMVQQSE